MSAYESLLLYGGLIGGILFGWILRSLSRPYTASGSITVDSDVTCTATGITVTGRADPDEGSRVIRLWTFLAPDAATTMPSTNHEPPPGSHPHEPQTGLFTLTHPVNGVPSGEQRLFVFAAFGTHNHATVNFTCGSGSGSGGNHHLHGAILLEPAARRYRMTVDSAAGSGTAPEVRRALERGEVFLAFDPLRAAGGEAVWSEEASASETVRWRLTLRKVGDTHVAALELVTGSGPTTVWRCRQWHFFAASRFAADSAGRHLPSLEVRPA